MRKHIMRDNYESIKSILLDAGIKKPADINSLHIENGFVSSKDYPWIQEVANLLEEKFVAAQATIWMNEGQYFLIENMTCVTSDKLSKYACFFPERTLVSAGDLIIDRVAEEHKIQSRVLFSHFYASQISENNIGFFAPKKIISNSMEQPLFYNDDQNKVAKLNQISTGKLNPVVESIFVGLPWLYNARIEDYVELIDKYHNEFENYNLYIRKIAESATTEKELTITLVKEINDICSEMKILLHRKSKELKSKGIITAIGLCLTCIPFLMPDTIKFISPEIFGALAGGKTVFDSLQLTDDALKMSGLNQEKPLWIIWKWLNESQKI